MRKIKKRIRDVLTKILSVINPNIHVFEKDKSFEDIMKYCVLSMRVLFISDNSDNVTGPYYASGYGFLIDSHDRVKRYIKTDSQQIIILNDGDSVVSHPDKRYRFKVLPCK